MLHDSSNMGTEAQGSGRHLLLLEGRAPPAPGRPTDRRHLRNTCGRRRPCHWVVHDLVGSRRRADCPNRRRLPPSRHLRSSGARRRQRHAAGPAHRATPPGVEVGRELVIKGGRVRARQRARASSLVPAAGKAPTSAFRLQVSTERFESKSPLCVSISPCQRRGQVVDAYTRVTEYRRVCP